MLLIINDVMTRLVLVFWGAFNIYVQREGPRTWGRVGPVIHYPDITADGVMLFTADPIIFLPIFVTLSGIFKFWTDKLHPSAPAQRRMAKVTTLCAEVL